MAAALSVLLLSNFMSCFKTATISPTSITNETETYQISSSNQYDAIICSKPECEVLCNVTNACYKIVIDGTLSDILDVKCTNQLSCQGITISQPAAIYNRIQCTHKSSCYEARFNLIANQTTANKPDISILCDQNIDTSSSSSPCRAAITKIDYASNINITCGAYGCYYNSFYLNYSESATFNVGYYGLSSAKINTLGDDSSTASTAENVIINSYGNHALYGLSLYCAISSNCTLNCYSSYSCYSLDVLVPNTWTYDGFHVGYDADTRTDIDVKCANNGWQTSTISPNSISGRLQCDSYECCPMEFVTDIITCTKDNCNYDCSDDSITCANSIIKAPDATSLTVSCPTKESCSGTRIHCPSTSNASCIIQCTGYSACEYMAIQALADYIDTFQLYCGGNDYHHCEASKLILGFISINTLDLQMHYGVTSYDPWFQYLKASSHIGSFIYGCTNWCRGNDLNLVPSFRELNIIVDDLNIYCETCEDMNMEMDIKNSFVAHCEECGSFDVSVGNSFVAYCEECGSFNVAVGNSFDLTCDGSKACIGDINIELLNVSASTTIDCINTPDYYLTAKTSGACSGNFNIKQPSLSPINFYSFYVNCFEEGACAQGTFNFTNIGVPTFNCSGEYSCYKSTIIADTSALFYMFCDNDSGNILGYGACEQANVYCPSGFENSCTFVCPAGSHDQYDVCNDLSVSSTGYYATDYLRLICPHDYTNCPDPSLDGCYDYCTDFSIGCDDGSTTGIEYDWDEYEYKCVDQSSSSCCPWSNGEESITTTTAKPTLTPKPTSASIVTTSSGGGSGGETTSSESTLTPAPTPTSNGSDTSKASNGSGGGLTTLETILVVVVVLLVVVILGYIGYRVYRKRTGGSSDYQMMDNEKLLETKDQPL